MKIRREMYSFQGKKSRVNKSLALFEKRYIFGTMSCFGKSRCERNMIYCRDYIFIVIMESGSVRSKIIALGIIATILLGQLPLGEVSAASFYGKRTFKVTAYYSPLPGQDFYTTGSYEAEKRLNGEGVRGASGQDVFPGMIAAPKTYPFGTKIYLEGLGVGTVADRGGAIVHAGEQGQSYDRLDIWMGYGDEGLKRALKWGVRVVPGEILQDGGTPDTIVFDNVTLPSKPQVTKEDIIKQTSPDVISEVERSVEVDELHQSFPGYMGKDEKGDNVAILQIALKRLGYLDGDITGEYDEYTIIAILRLQLQHKIVEDENEYAAGYFGVATRRYLLEDLHNKGIEYGDLMDAFSTYKKSLDQNNSKEQQQATATTAAHTQMPAEEAPKIVLDLPQRRQMVLSDIFAYEHTAVLASAEEKHSSLYIPYTEYGDAPNEFGDIEIADLSSTEITRLQIMLKSLGFYQASPTGKYDTTTQKAIAKLQNDNNLATNTTVLTEETQKFLQVLWTRHVGVWGFTENLKLGQQSAEVARLKTLLQRKGYYTAQIDTTFDEELQKALAEFQLDYKVVSSSDVYGTGMVGPLTRVMLNRVLFGFKN